MYLREEEEEPGEEITGGLKQALDIVMTTMSTPADALLEIINEHKGKMPGLIQFTTPKGLTITIEQD